LVHWAIDPVSVCVFNCTFYLVFFLDLFCKKSKRNKRKTENPTHDAPPSTFSTSISFIPFPLLVFWYISLHPCFHYAHRFHTPHPGNGSPLCRSLHLSASHTTTPPSSKMVPTHPSPTSHATNKAVVCGAIRVVVPTHPSTHPRTHGGLPPIHPPHHTPQPGQLCSDSCRYMSQSRQNTCPHPGQRSRIT
jgi:hypothetical protein